jgi:ArsR family transcriptional regulator, arsenate/arsenite/antimonite-responsive transcriptional repressor
MKTATKISVPRVFRALSDPTRLRILSLLLTGELCVCDIVNTLRVPQPMASRHLAYLKKAGLVRARRDGLWMHYELSQPQSDIHRSILASLEACRKNVPQLADDAAQLRRRCC